ncbi:MAG TPA: mannitol dehydrogenase family protein [Orrella sp.]
MNTPISTSPTESVVPVPLSEPSAKRVASDLGGQAFVYHPRPDQPLDAQPQVVHLGLGGFHRAHQAMVFDALMAGGSAGVRAGENSPWQICAVGMRSDKLAKQLKVQDYLYLVRVSDDSGSRWHAPSAIVKTLVAASQRDAVIDQIANAKTRWVTLTVTEKAYTPELARLIVDGLAKRQAEGLGGLTIASCDNLPDNGHVLQALCLEQARTSTAAPDLCDWIQTECRFPCSMVDGIVPAPSAEVRQAARTDLGLDDPSALGVEAFWEWVIEDAFVVPSDADALRSVGVVVSNDVAGFEQAKLWMLNGSHTVLASAGVVLGDAYIRQVIARPVMKQFIHGYMTHASGPLVGRPNWQVYRDALIKRFSNPMLDHACLQVYSDSSLKIPVRWLPVGERLLGRRKQDLNHEQADDAGLNYLAMAVAIFARSLWPVNQAGDPFVFNDPLAGELQVLAKDQHVDPAGVIEQLLRQSNVKWAIFGLELGRDIRFVETATHWLAQIHANGLEPSLQLFNQTGARQQQ